MLYTKGSRPRARELGVEVIAVSTPDYGVDAVADVAAAYERIGEVGPGDAVLVKASRVGGLERLAELLLADGAFLGRERRQWPDGSGPETSWVTGACK